MRLRSTQRVCCAAALAAAVAVGTACLGGGGTPGSRPPPSITLGRARPDRQPNVILFLTDDQRTPGTMQVMPKTRRWFGEGGVEFREAFVTTPLCCPSRASIFTGRYAHNHGVVRNELVARLDQRSTLQRYLRDEGYRTGIFGKFLNAWPVEDDPPNFDSWATSPTYYKRRFNIDGRVRATAPYNTRFLARRANRFIRRSERDDARPWFVFIATSAPHTPYEVERRYRGAPLDSWMGNPAYDESNRSDKPAYVRGQDEREEVEVNREGQLRTLMSVDDLVDDVMSEVRDIGEDSNTLSFFLSDNGYMWGEHGLLTKRNPYTASIQVPMFMRWPAFVKAGVRDDRIAANIDVAPTVMDAAGIEVDAMFPMDGLSLLSRERRDQILLEQYQNIRGPDWASLRTAGYQFVEYYRPSTDEVLEREYYDLDADPWQLQNLLGDGDGSNDPDVDGLVSELDRAKRCGGSEECP